MGNLTVNTWSGIDILSLDDKNMTLPLIRTGNVIASSLPPFTVINCKRLILDLSALYSVTFTKTRLDELAGVPNIVMRID